MLRDKYISHADGGEMEDITITIIRISRRIGQLLVTELCDDCDLERRASMNPPEFPSNIKTAPSEKRIHLLKQYLN